MVELTKEKIDELVAKMIEDKKKEYASKKKYNTPRHHSRFDSMTDEEYRFWVDEHQ